MSTDIATQTVLGISISPHALSAAVLSTDEFEILGSYKTELPENTLSADGQRILDINALTRMLGDLKAELALDDTISTYLSIVPSVLDTQQVESTQPNAILHELEQLVLMPDVIQQGVLKDARPVLQHTMMGKNDDEVLVGYGLAGSQLIQDYEEAFLRAGLKLESIDLLPLCVLRAMAASGVLDAMLQKIGPEGIWGCFGTVGAKTWITLWKGTTILELGSFNTPKSKQAWRNRILTVLELAGVDEPELWFSWQEPGSVLPASPEKLELKAPVKEAFLGPIFKSASQHHSIFPALGAALKADISFPLGWEFKIQRLAEPSQRFRRAERPETPLPLKLMWAGIGLLIFLSATSLLVWNQNNEYENALTLRTDQIKAALQAEIYQNPLYTHVLKIVNQKASLGNPSKGEGIQLDQIRLRDDDILTVSGSAYQKVFIDRFVKRLNTPGPKDVIIFSAPTFSTATLPTKPPMIAFEYRAQVTRNPQLFEEGQQ